MSRFLSFRWKILLLAGLVMAVLAGLLTAQQWRTLNRHFDAQHDASRAQAQVTAERLLRVQSERVQVLARMLVEMPAIRASLIEQDAVALMRAAEPLWPELNLGQGVLALAFFDAGHQAMQVWGEADRARLETLSYAARASEAPQYWLGCDAQCTHLVALPVAERGRAVGTVALAIGLEGVILDLQRLADAEVALLSRAPAAAYGAARVLSVSGGAPVEAVLQRALEAMREGSHTVVQAQARTWQVARFAPDYPGDGRLQLVLLEDVSAAQQAIVAASLGGLAWSAGALGLALLLLYLGLRPTTRRMRRIARLLPLLGQERYAEVAQLPPPRRPKTWVDEMFLLERLAHELAHRLKSLHDADQAHRATLAAQAAQLEQERDLVAGLLDTAPVIIVTYGRDDRIRMANAFAVMDSGLERERLLGRSFGGQFLEPAAQITHRRQLEAMLPGDVQRGEGRFLRHGDAWREVIWFHTCLDDASGERLFLSVGLDVTDQRLAEQRLQSLAERDAVTGLLNRRAFNQALDAIISPTLSGMLLVCDLDEFRALNDSEGHAAGDRVLMSFADHLQRLEPRPQLMARLGSDEFALLYTGLASADAILLARQLSRVLIHGALHTAERSDGRPLPAYISACVGLADLRTHGATADILLGNAELALAHARAKGHGSWHLYADDETGREHADRRAYWRAEVEQALDEDRFELHFQPIIDVASGQISHHEALLRLRGRDGRLVSPGLFIDVAESTGLIRRIDRWVVEAVVRIAAVHREARLAFNLSSRSFDDDMAFETMQAALRLHHVAGERLWIEITETAALANFSGAKRIMAKFQELGCVFGLDDFGVGYSSFQYLRELPVGFVKIDGSFIRNLTHNADDVVFVRALNSAVQGFGKTTVAEFVEDEQTLEILRGVGVDLAQGYLIGKPGPELVLAVAAANP